jgi:phage-Barnase-EndoU-ColicinE5/D-RelE like nuclease2
MRLKGLKVTQNPPEGTKTITNKRTGEVREVPLGIDPGFDYNPGAAGREALQLRPLEVAKVTKADEELPPATQVDYGPLKGGQTVPADQLFPDLPSRTGRPVKGQLSDTGDSFFRTFTGEYKFKDATSGGGRRSYVIMLAEVLRRPDEIWEVQRRILTTGKVITRRRYIGRYTIQGSNETMDALAVFEYDPVARQWFGNTVFSPDMAKQTDYLDHQRKVDL